MGEICLFNIYVASCNTVYNFISFKYKWEMWKNISKEINIWNIYLKKTNVRQWTMYDYYCIMELLFTT